MQVNILCREPEADLSISSAAASNTVRAVLKQFCKHLSITERDCQLFCDDVPLSVEQKLSQVPGCSSGVIYLLARIQPSVALYHWQLFHQARLCNTCNYSALWQAATAQYVHAHTYEQQLPPPQDIAAFNTTTRMLLPLHCPPSSDRAAPVLPSALAPVRPLFQLTQVLFSQVPSRCPHDRTVCQPAPSLEADSSQQIKSGAVNPVAPSPADEVAMLQTLLLVLKLISLVIAVASSSVSANSAVVVLWEILVGTLNKLRHIEGKPDWLFGEGSLESMRSAHTSHPKGWMETAVALTKMLMTQLRQCLVKDGMSEQAQLCCTTLASVLEIPRIKRSYCMAVAMAAAIKDPAFGGLAVLVSGLKKCSGARGDKHARTIVHLLDVLCSPRYMTADSVEQHLKLLAQMQTAVHLSGLFCPILDKGDAPTMAEALCLFENKFIRDAAADQMPSAVEQIITFTPLAHLMRRLLAVDRQSQPDSQGFMQRMALPLPEANALWQSREKIALRAFFLLDCVQNWLAPDGAHAHLTLPRSALMQHDISSLLIEYIVQTLHECLAGHLFDPRLDVRMVFSRGFNGVMYAWAQREGDSLDNLHSLGNMFLSRLVSQYKVLLHGTFADLDQANLLVRPLAVAAVWSMILERFKEGQMGTIADAMEALHALLCHTTYCHQLLGRGCLPMLPCFKPLLLALQPFPAAQLTFGASLVCLAAVGSEWSQHLPDNASRASSVKAGASAVVSSIRQNRTLDAICSCLQDALLLPMPWSTEHIVSLARVMQRMAILCRQQPQLVSPIIKEAQASVLQPVLRLLPDLHPGEAQDDLLIGALLFSGLPFKEPFGPDADISQDVIDNLAGLLKSHSMVTDTASSASNTASPAAAASGTADASSQSDAQQPTSSEHAQTTPQALQASLHTEWTQAGELTGDGQRVFGLIQHSDIEIQPVILSSLLACLPRQHVIIDAMFADCKTWFIQVAENLVLMGQQEEPWLAIPFIPYYFTMMDHMEWRSMRKVPARLSEAFIRVLLLMLSALKYRHEESKAKAHASRSLTSAERVRNMTEARLLDNPQQGLCKNLGVITGPKPLPGSLCTDEHGSLNLLDLPMQLRVENVEEIKELIGMMLRCMQHMQEDADWQLAVAVDFLDSQKWQAWLPAIIKQLVPVLPHADMCKLSCYLEPLLNLHADAAAAAEQLVEEDQQAAASALAKAAAKKAKKQRQKLKKSPSSPEPQHSIDSGQNTAIGQPSPASNAQHSMGSPNEQQHGEAVEQGAGPPSPAASEPAISQTSTFLLNLFRCPLSKVMMSDPVVAADGHTYERAAITSWLQQHTTSPVTKQPLPHMRIFSNQAAKAAIANQHVV